MLSRFRNSCNRTAFCTSLGRSRINQSFYTRSGLLKSAEPEESSATSKFLKSFGVLLEEPERKGVVGRWDWHLWQIIVMLLPSLGVAGLAYLARYDMRIQEAKLNARKQEREAQDPECQKAQAEQKARMQKDAQIEQDRQQQHQVQAKLEELEQAVRLMHVRQLIQEMTGSKRLPVADADHQVSHTNSESQTSQEETLSGHKAAHLQQSSSQQKPPAEKQANAEAKDSPRLHADTRTSASQAAERQSQAEHQNAPPGHCHNNNADSPGNADFGNIVPSSTVPDKTEAADTESGNIEPSVNFRSQPTAVAAVRHYVKHQVSAVYTSIKNTFVGGHSAHQQEDGKEHQKDKS